MWERFLGWILCWEPKHQTQLPAFRSETWRSRWWENCHEVFSQWADCWTVTFGFHIYIWHPELFLFGRWVLQPSMPSGHYMLQEVRIWREKLQISSDHRCIFCVVFSDNNGHDADAWRKLRGWTPCGPAGRRGRRGRRGRGQVVKEGGQLVPHLKE